MYKVRIFGAGSIGNHLAYGCRRKGWSVEICDVDRQALERTKTDIYPVRYGAWDEDISLCHVDELSKEYRDIVIVGTPPEYHIPIALAQIRSIAPKVILIEKPLCCPSLEGVQEIQQEAERVGCVVLTGYNHTLTSHTMAAEKVLAKEAVGDVLTIDAGFREHWGGIFAAHPWLAGPKESYLGFFAKGGGATGEHSHAINIWQHFAHITGKGRITQVAARHDMVCDDGLSYDRVGQLVVETESGLVGNIVQDVITRPAEKIVKIRGSAGILTWQVNVTPDSDAVFVSDSSGEIHTSLFPKSRPDDFAGEIDHLGSLLEDPTQDSPISLRRGIETMLVIAAAYKSSAENRVVSIDYECSPENALH
jgi:predicted dehydrogenase